MEKITIYPWTKRIFLTLDNDILILDDGKNEKSVPLSKVISIEVRPAKGKMTPGTMKITLDGAPDSYLSFVPFMLTGGSNIIEFHQCYECETDAQKIKDYIVNYLRRSQENNQNSVSQADEIRKLKELVNDGILTEEEFVAKKKQLLGL